jgi:hypothetical protein
VPRVCVCVWIVEFVEFIEFIEFVVFIEFVEFIEFVVFVGFIVFVRLMAKAGVRRSAHGSRQWKGNKGKGVRKKV